MTFAQVVKTSVTNNGSFQDYLHPDDRTIWTTDNIYYANIIINIKNPGNDQQHTSSNFFSRYIDQATM